MCGVFDVSREYAIYITSYHLKLRLQLADKSVHEWETNKRMTALFVHSFNVCGRFAIPHKTYDIILNEVNPSSNAAIRHYRRISP